jgi:hypothetical protein
MLAKVLPISVIALASASGSLAGDGSLVGPAGFTDGFTNLFPGRPDSSFGPAGSFWGDNPFIIPANGAYIGFTTIEGDRLVRMRTFEAQTPGSLFNGVAYPSARRLFPAPGDNATVSADLRASNLAELYTFEVLDTNISAALSRAIFGGEFAAFHYLVATSPTIGEFVPFRVCTDSTGAEIPGCSIPNGSSLGDTINVPVDAWFALKTEMTHDGRQRHLVDLNDGNGFVLAGEAAILVDTVANIGDLRINSSFQAQDALLLIDNISMRGYFRTCSGDSNGNGAVNFEDLNAVLSNFGSSAAAGFPFGDVTNDQIVNFDDLNATLSAFGNSCPE